MPRCPLPANLSAPPPPIRPRGLAKSRISFAVGLASDLPSRRRRSLEWDVCRTGEAVRTRFQGWAATPAGWVHGSATRTSASCPSDALSGVRSDGALRRAIRTIPHQHAAEQRVTSAVSLPADGAPREEEETK